MKKKLFTYLIIICVYMAAQAVSPTPTELRDQIVDNIMLENIRATSALQTAQSEKENLLPGLQIEYESLWSRNSSKWSLGVSQSFQWPKVYEVRRNLIVQNAKLTELLEASTRLDFKLQATRLLVQLSFGQQRINLVDSLLANLRRLDATIDSALDRGLVTILDKKKSGIEIANLQIERDQLQANQDLLIGELSKLSHITLKTDSVDWLQLPLIPSLASLSDYNAEIQRDPNILAEHCRKKSAELGVEVAKKSTFPEFSVGYKHSYEEGSHYDGFAVGIGLPSWKYKKTIVAAQTEVQLMETHLSVQEKVIYARIATEYKTAQKLKTILTRLRHQGIDHTYLTLLGKAKAAGQLTMLDYLREQNYYQETALGLLNIEEEYTLLLVSLNRYRL